MDNNGSFWDLNNARGIYDEAETENDIITQLSSIDDTNTPQEVADIIGKFDLNSYESTNFNSMLKGKTSNQREILYFLQNLSGKHKDDFSILENPILKNIAAGLILGSSQVQTISKLLTDKDLPREELLVKLEALSANDLVNIIKTFSFGSST